MSAFLVSYSIVLIETACMMIFFEIFIQDSRNRRQPFIKKWIAIMLMGFFSCGIAFLFIDHTLLKQIIDILWVALATSVYFKEKLSKCLVLSIIHAGILWLADFITILAYLSVALGSGETSETEEFLIILLAKLVLFFIIMLMDKIFRHNMTGYMKGTDWLIFLIIPIISLITVPAYQKNIRIVAGTELERLLAVSAWGLVFINILMFYWMQHIGIHEYLLREKALLETETRNQLQMYQAISEKMQQQRKISHEYENHLTCIQALCEAKKYDELETYLEEIRGKAVQNINYIDTGHSIVNAVLNAKYQEAVQKNILVVWKVNDLSNLAVSSSDLVILLSNLLGNALEACEKCGQERCIHIKCFYEEEELILSVRNTYDGRLNILNGEIYTTKTEEKESHGFGLKNVMQVIEKNHGYYTVGHTETEFWVSIVIPQGDSTQL